MKKVLVVFIFFLPTTLVFGQIWSEDFNAYPAGTMNAPPKWTTTALDCDDGGALNLGPGASQWGVYAGQFTVNDIEGAPCCPAFGGGGGQNDWTTEVIDISNHCDVVVSIDITGMGSMECDSPGVPIFGCQNTTPPDNSHDQVVAEYNLNGTVFTQFAYVCGSIGFGAFSSPPLNGNTLQLRVRIANKANSEYYYFDNVIVNGTPPIIPNFNTLGPLCENDPPLLLPTVSNEGISGTWDVGPTFNPAGQGGSTVTINFTPNPGQCAGPTSTTISVLAATNISLPNLGPICETDPPIVLDPVQGGYVGIWSGPGVAGNLFNPAGLGGMYTLTFTPNPGNCANPATTIITVDPSVTPMLGTATLCEIDPPYDLTLLQDPMYSSGTWQGPGVAGIFFDPTGQNGPITISFISSDACVLPVSTTITVNTPADPILTTDQICDDNGLYDLTLLEDPTYTNGTWGGPGVSGTNFDPTGQSDTVNFIFISSDPCVNIATTYIVVDIAASLVLEADTLCENNGLFDLTQLEDTLYQGGAWTGSGVTGTNFDPTGQSGSITLYYNPNQNCVQSDSTTIEVNLIQTPVLGTDTICELDGIYDLSQLNDPLFPNGIWSGLGVTGSNFDPTGLSGSVALSFTPDLDCVASENTEIFVNNFGTPNLGTDTICENNGLYDLTLLLDPSFPSGTWSGIGVTGNFFDPLNNLGNIQLTFTSSDECADPTSTTINVSQPVIPTLGTADICENSGIYNLTQLLDSLYTTGTWSGIGVTGNDFDPTGLAPSVLLTFVSDQECVDTATATINITASDNPDLGSAEICEGSGMYNLNLLLDPNYTTGTWSGQGVSGNSFDPTGLSGLISLYFDSDEDCVNTDSTTIEIIPNSTPNLLADTICQENGIIDLSTLEDVNFPGGTWSGPGVNNSDFDPNGLSGTVTIFYAPIGDCEQNASTEIIINSAPSFSNLLFDCDPTNQFYTVSFDVNGGNPSTYTVDGSPLIGNNYISPQITNGAVYNFQLDDGNNCGPITITGSFNCNCATNSGTMDFTNSPLQICDGNSFEVDHNQNENLDGDDLFQYILHDQAGTQLGNIISISDTTLFDFPIGITFGQTYYVSAVAGSNDGSGSIDLTDACLSISPGLPVSFYQLGVTLSNGGDICEDECQSYDINFVGNPPFELIFDISTPLGIFSDTLVSDTNFINYDFCPAAYNLTQGEIEINPVSLNDINCDNFSQNSSVQTIIIHNNPITNLSPTLCPGESILVNGVFYDETNLSGTEIIVDGSQYSCDSTINVDVNYHPVSELMLSQNLCEGESIQVNGNTYDASTSSGIEIVSNGSVNGCDSTIYVDLSFTLHTINDFNPTICLGDFVEVNGNIYDETIPSGIEIVSGGASTGCDSIININLDFHPIAAFDYSESLCEDEERIINGTTYDSTNPDGTEIIQGASINGCDSVINIQLEFHPLPNENFDAELCQGDSITINGTIYHQNNPSGTEIFVDGSSQGCDSVVQVTLNFIPPSQFDLSSSLCEGSNIIVNGTTYNQNNPTGTEIIPNGSISGCDSIINVSLDFTSEVIYDINETLCLGESIEVNGTVYDQNNPSGMETFENGSAMGCDSIVNITLSYFTSAEYLLMDTLCEGSSVTVNGSIYDVANPTGTEILAGASFNGCDSTVFIDLDFNFPSSFDLNQTLCTDETIIVNGTTYGFNNSTGIEVFQGGNEFGCDSTVSIILNFFPPAEGFIQPEICAGGSIIINGETFDINNPNGTQLLPDISINGCDSTLNISLIILPDAVENLFTEICEDESLTINGTVYDINNPSGSEFFPNGSYEGCDSTLNISLNFLSDVEFDINEVLPIGQSITVNGTVYNENNPFGTEVIPNGAFNGCDSIINVNLEFFEELDATFSVFPPTCFGEADGSIIIDTIIGGSTDLYFVNLEGQAPIPYNTFPIEFLDLQSGDYILNISDGTQTLQLNITIQQPTQIVVDLGDDQTITLGESIAISPQTNITPDSILWEPSLYLDCDNCYPAISTPGEDITYTLTLMDQFGCISSDDITIFVQKVRNVYIPNAFSPNGDGINDRLTVFAGQNVSQVNNLRVFSRWGELLFEAENFAPNDVNFGWDGIFNGEKMNAGLYIFFTEIEFLDGEKVIFKGDFALIR